VVEAKAEQAAAKQTL